MSIRETVWEYETDDYSIDVPRNGLELLEFLKDRINDAPEKYRKDVEIVIDGANDGVDSFGRIKICYDRPETKEELEKVAEYKARCEALKERQEREQYLKLKGKFEREI